MTQTPAQPEQTQNTGQPRELPELQQILQQLREEMKALQQQQKDTSGSTKATETSQRTKTKDEEAKEARFNALQQVEDVKSVIVSGGNEINDLGWIAGEIGQLQQVEHKLQKLANDNGVQKDIRDQIGKDLVDISDSRSRLLRESKRLRDDLLNNPTSPLSTVDKAALLLTGKTTEQLKRGDQRELGKTLWLVAQYVQDNGTRFGVQSSDVQQILELRNTAATLLQQDEVGQTMLGQLQARYEGDGPHVWTNAHERLVFTYLADPDGTEQQQNNSRVYKQKIAEIISAIKERPEEFNTKIRAIIEKLAHGRIGELPESDLDKATTEVDETQRTEKQIKALRKRAREEARTRVGVTEEQRETRVDRLQRIQDFLVTTYGEEADPEMFMQLAEAQIAELGPSATLEQKLGVIARITSQFHFAGEDGRTLDQFAPGVFFNDSGQAIRCTMTEFLIEQLIEEGVVGDDLIVATAWEQTKFGEKLSIDNTKQGHIQLIVMDKNGNDGYYIDPADTGHMLQRIDLAGERQQILDAYNRGLNSKSAIFTDESGKPFVLHKYELDKQIIGNTDLALVAHLNNFAVLTDSRDLAEVALGIQDNLVSRLAIYRLTEDDTERQQQLKSIIRYSDRLLQMLKDDYGISENDRKELEKLKINAKGFDEKFDQKMQNRIFRESIEKFKNDFDAMMADDNAREKLLTERVVTHSTLGAMEQEWEGATDDRQLEMLEEAYQQIERAFKNRLTGGSEDFNSGTGYMKTFLLAHAADYDTRHKAQGSNREEYYTRLIITGDVDVGWSIGNYNLIQEREEIANYDKTFGLYEMLDSLQHAHAAVEVGVATLSVEHGDLSDRFGDLATISDEHLARYGSFLVDANRIAALAKEKKTATSTATKHEYGYNEWSRHQSRTRVKQGPQSHAGQKGLGISEAFNPFMTNQEQLGILARQIVQKGLGLPKAKNSVPGLKDLSGMQTLREAHQGNYKYTYLTDRALFRQHKLSISGQSAYEAQQASFRDAQRIIVRNNLSGHVLSRLGELQGEEALVIENTKSWLIQNGHTQAEVSQMSSERFLEAIQREEQFLDIKAKAYDRYTGEDRFYFDQEILARNLVYQAHGFYDGYLLDTPTQLSLLSTIGKQALQKGIQIGTDNLDRGRKLNTQLYNFMLVIDQVNEDFEVDSGIAARRVTDAVEKIQIAIANGADFSEVIRLEAEVKARESERDNFLASTPEQRELKAAQDALSLKRQEQGYITAENTYNQLKTTYDRKVSHEIYQKLERQEQDIQIQIYNLRQRGFPDTHPDMVDLHTRLTNTQGDIDRIIGQDKRNMEAAKQVLENYANAEVDRVTAAEAAMVGLQATQAYQDKVNAVRTAEGKRDSVPQYKEYTAFIKAQKLMLDHKKHLEEYIAKRCQNNEGQRIHFQRQLDAARRATDALDQAAANPADTALLERAADLSRRAQTERQMWHQVLTAENWYQYQNKGQLPVRPDLTEANKYIPILKQLYEEKAMSIAGKNNWRNIVSATSQNVGGLRDFHFQSEGQTLWQDVLNGQAEIEGWVNEGKTHILWYFDEPRKVLLQNKELNKLTSNKPWKGNTGDVQAAMKAKEALMAFLNNPLGQKERQDMVGKISVFNDDELEHLQHAELLDGALKAFEQAVFLRCFLPDPMGRFVEALFPELKPLFGKVSPQFYEQSNNQFIRDYINECVRMNFITADWGEKLKKKHKVRITDSLAVYGTSWLQWFVMYFVLNPKALGLEMVSVQ